jgi:hypothetical protein
VRERESVCVCVCVRACVCVYGLEIPKQSGLGLLWAAAQKIIYFDRDKMFILHAVNCMSKIIRFYTLKEH